MDIIKIKEPFGHSYHRIFQEITPTMKDGAVILYGTDTCWGLSAPISSRKGIKKIYEIKKRPSSKAVSIAVSDIQMAHKYAHISKETAHFIHNNLPGRISLVVPAKLEAFPVGFRLPDDKVSIRIPADLFTRRLAASVGEPLITTSANLSGEKELYTWKEVENFLEKTKAKPDLVIFKKRIQKSIPSTIIDTTTIPWSIIRQGPFVLKK